MLYVLAANTKARPNDSYACFFAERGAEEEPEPFASKKNKTNQKGEAGPSKVEKEANVPPFVPKPTPYDEDLAKLTVSAH